MTENKVELYVYDLTQGVAAVMSPVLIGKKNVMVYVILG